MTTEVRESISEINRTIPLYKALKFVVSARAKSKDSRPILELMKVETRDNKKYAYCADGFRLHIADITEQCAHLLADGLYEVVKVTAPRIELKRYTGDEVVYPNVWTLIPDNATLKMQELDTNFYSHGDPDIQTSACYTRMVRAAEHGTIQFKYFEDIQPSEFNWQFHYFHASSPFLFKTNKNYGDEFNLIAVVMPVFIKD
jgi:hypothetical protein